MKNRRRSAIALIAVVLVAGLIASCADYPDDMVSYTDDDGIVQFARGTLGDMMKLYEKAGWPCEWDGERLVLQVGEISEEVEAFGEPQDQMFILEFERTPNCLSLVKATNVTGAHKTISVLNSSDTVPDTPYKMRLSAAALLPWMLGVN